MDLRIGLGSRQIGMDLSEHELRNRQPQRAADFSGHQLRNQSAGALSGAAKLQDIQSVVIGFDDCRQGATLPERRNVAGNADRTRQLHTQILPRLPS